jgi:hypothetical protein
MATAAVAALGVSGAAAAGCANRQRSAEAFCAKLAAVQDLDDVLAGGSAPRAIELAADLRELRHVAPEELDPHVARLSAVTDELVSSLGTAPDPDSAASEVFTRRQAELPAITESGRAVESFATQHCQISLNPAATAPAPTEPPTTTATTELPTTRKSSTTARRATSTRVSSTSRRASTTSSTRRG